MKKITFTKKQYKDLVLSMLVGNMVIKSVLENEYKDFKHLNALENHILTSAKKFGLEDMVEDFEKELISSDDLDEEVERIVEEYENDTFWEDLITCLGKRDYLEGITKEEEAEIKKKNWLPERIHEYYEKYRTEFEKNGIKNLKVVNNIYK